LNGGSVWNSLSGVSLGSARLLKSDGQHRVRFVPTANFSGNAEIRYRAWDQTSGEDGALADLTGVGGGAWVLVAYGAQASLGGSLTAASGSFSSSVRNGSAVLPGALEILKNSSELAMTWTASGGSFPSGGTGSYTHGIAFALPNAAGMSFDGSATSPLIYYNGNSYNPLDSSFAVGSSSPDQSLVNVRTLVGSPGMPSQMYLRNKTFGAGYGGVYGLVMNDGSNAQLDYGQVPDGQTFKAVYLDHGTGAAQGQGLVMGGAGGAQNSYVPSTMAIWARLDSYQVLTLSGNNPVTGSGDYLLDGIGTTYVDVIDFDSSGAFSANTATGTIAVSPATVAPSVPFTYTIENEKVTITGYTGTGGNVVIPGTIEGKPVTRIANQAFKQKTSITAITLPDSVTTIGAEAFYHCDNLTSMTFGSGLKVIGDWAFAWCGQLPTLVIPDSVTSLGEGAVSDCSALTSLTIGNQVPVIWRFTFSGDSNLTAVTLPASVGSIGEQAFSHCTKLANINFQQIVPPYVNGDAFLDIASGSRGYYLESASIGWSGMSGTGSNSGKALSLNGSDQFMVAGNGADHVLTTGTIECWIKSDVPVADTDGFHGIIVKQGAYGLFLKGNELIAYDWQNGGERRTYRLLRDEHNNAWHHVAMSFQSGVTDGTVIYLDGQPILTTTYTVGSSEEPLAIGAGFAGAVQLFQGMMDEVRVWNVVRTPAEIATYRNVSIPSSFSGLVSYFKFDEGSGSLAGNAVAGGATATLYNSPSWGSLSISGLTFPQIKESQLITFSTLPPKKIGDAAFNLTATASSGLAVTYTSSDPNVATISGSTVTLLAAGTTTITASQPGNATYAAATPVSQVLTVNTAATGTGDGSGGGAIPIGGGGGGFSASPSALSSFEATYLQGSSVQTFTLTATGLTDGITVTAPNALGFVVSADGVSFYKTLTLSQPPVGPYLQTIYVKIPAYAFPDTGGGNIEIRSGQSQAFVSVSGTVLPFSPALNLPTTLTYGSRIILPGAVDARQYVQWAGAEIPDGAPAVGVRSSVDVSGRSASNYNLQVGISIMPNGAAGTGWLGDLKAYLRHEAVNEAGVSIVDEVRLLFDRIGTGVDPDGSLADGLKMIFADEGQSGIQNVNPEDGSYLQGVWKPASWASGTATEMAGPLSTMGGTANNWNGTWTLVVADTQEGNVMKLEGWSLRFMDLPVTGAAGAGGGLEYEILDNNQGTQESALAKITGNELEAKSGTGTVTIRARYRAVPGAAPGFYLSPASEWATVSILLERKSQVITLNPDPLPAKRYGDPIFSVTATADSNLPVTLESSNPDVAIISVRGVSTVANGLQCPIGVVADASGNVYVADTNGNKIWKIGPRGAKSVFAGSGGAFTLDGTGTEAALNGPVYLARGSDGTIYVSQLGDQAWSLELNRYVRRTACVRKITSGGVVSTVELKQENGIDLLGLDEVNGIAVDQQNNMIIAERGKHRIWKIAPNGVGTVLAGSGVPDFADGTGAEASFNTPVGVVVDALNHVYVADAWNHRVRKIDATTGEVTTVAGSVLGFDDGVGTGAHFCLPNDLVLDRNGDLIVADQGNHKIRKISLQRATMGLTTTLAGTGTIPGIGEAGDGSLESAKFRNLCGICVNPSGDIYASEGLDGIVRKVVLDEGVKIQGVGQTTIRATQGGDANYLAATLVERVLTVDKQVPTITSVPTASRVALGSALSDSLLAGGSASTAGVFYFKAPQTVPLLGTIEQDVIFVPSDAERYQAVEFKVAVEVYNPIVSVTLTLGNLDQTYNGQPRSVTAAASVAGAPVPNLNYQVLYSGATNPPTTAGTYSVTAEVTSSGYTGSATGTLTISRATPQAYAIATPIAQGQALARSTLAGSARMYGYGGLVAIPFVMNVPGSFVWKDSRIIPPLGNSTQEAVFTPQDETNFNSVTFLVGVTVYDPDLPVANPDAFTAKLAAGMTTKVTTASLIANDQYSATPGESRGVSFVSASATSTGGASIRVKGGWVIYQPGSAAQDGTTDTFTYTVSNGLKTATGTVTVSLASPNYVAEVAFDRISGSQVYFSVMPGMTFEVQGTSGLGSSATWTTIPGPNNGNWTSQANGRLIVTDPEAATAPARFYKLRWMP